MSDMMEIDTGDEVRARIVAVGEAVSRAADELKRAVERLTTGMSLPAGLTDVHRCRAWVEKRGGDASLRVFLPDVMDLASPHAPATALPEHGGVEEEPVAI